jgi:hypothetical protein
VEGCPDIRYANLAGTHPLADFFAACEGKRLELVGIYTDTQKSTSKTFKAALSDVAKEEWM